MKKFIEFFRGKKTYLAAVGIGIVAALRSLGYLDDDTASVLTELLAGAGLAALRLALVK